MRCSPNGCEVDSNTEKSELGYFGWVMDPEGNRVEPWQPPTPSNYLKAAPMGLAQSELKSR